MINGNTRQKMKREVLGIKLGDTTGKKERVGFDCNIEREETLQSGAIEENRIGKKMNVKEEELNGMVGDRKTLQRRSWK